MAVLLLLVLAGITYFLWPRSRTYHGRSLRNWLAKLDDGKAERGITWLPERLSGATPEQREAAEAIRRMGVQAEPELLAMLRCREPLPRVIKAVVQRWISRGRQPVNYAYERQTPATLLRHQAALGLIVLDPQAKPAVSELAPLLDNGELCKETALVLASMGPPGSILLKSSITNRSSWQAVCAIWALAQFPTNAQPIVPDLLAGLTNQSSGFSDACAWALNRIPIEPELAVPALTNAASNPQLRYLCLRALATYGTRAASAVPFLEQMLKLPGPANSEVLETLRSIDPVAAAKAQSSP